MAKSKNPVAPVSGTASERQLKHIPLDNIDPPDLNMRTNVDDEKLQQLAASISAIGLLQPIVVVPKGDKFSIVAGFRRYLAHVMLKRHSILCRIVALSTTGAYMATWHENIFREDTNPLDDAIYLARLIKLTGMSQSDLAKSLGKSQQWVSQRTKILDWPQQLKDALEAGKVSFSVARELSHIEDETLLEHYLFYAIKNGITPQVAQNWRQQFQSSIPLPDQPVAGDTEPEDPGIYRPPELVCQLCMSPGELQVMTHIWVHSRCLTTFLEAFHNAEKE